MRLKDECEGGSKRCVRRNLVGIVSVVMAASVIACSPSRQEKSRQEAAADIRGCGPPDTLAGSVVEIGWLPGTYELTMYIAAGEQKGSDVSGHLTLERWSREGPEILKGLSWIVEGHTDLALDKGEADSLQPATARIVQSVDLPKQVVGSRGRDSTVFLEQGEIERSGSVRPRRAPDWVVWAADSMGLKGTWAVGFWRPPTPNGYFCARRTSG